MSSANPYLKQYQKNQIETASPEQVLILLYDGAIQFLIKAQTALDEKKFERFYNSIVSCQRIILEFMDTLDMEVGGELAKNLYKLYEYLYNTLDTVNIKKDRAKMEEVLKHLKALRETWQKAISISNAQKSAEMIEKTTDRYDGIEDDDDDEDYEEDLV